MNDQELVAALTGRLGLPAGSLKPELALEALRHGSFVHERSLAPGRELLRSNERLEFLGDAVLGFLIARWFYDRMPDAPEGDLTKLRASLVREESLAIAARDLGLGELLLLGRSEQRGGARENPARLADALEAVLAAVYLSCGMERAAEALERVLGRLIEQSQNGMLARDPKTELQHLFQSRRRSPQYRVLAATGPPHARSYEVEVCLDGTALARGSGRSKKEAEQAAARAALENPAALDLALLDEPVALQPPDPRWTELAREEMARLKGVLPEARLEHVGSTAVPGNDGRPVIDLLLGLPEVPPALKLPDYEACGEAGAPGRLLFRRRGAASFDVQAVRHEGPLWRDALLLREFLKVHPEHAAQSARAKADAIAAGATTLVRYAGERAKLLGDLLAQARAWDREGRK